MQTVMLKNRMRTQTNTDKPGRETQRSSVFQVQHTCVSNNSEQKDSSFHIPSSRFIEHHKKIMKSSVVHTLSKHILYDLSYSSVHVNRRYKPDVYNNDITDATQHISYSENNFLLLYWRKWLWANLILF